jgi:pimeloyl-ACP methyl ester carboxylesterase
MHRSFRWPVRASVALLVLLPLLARPEGLPRRSGPEERYPGVDVRYDEVADPAGHRLRLILAHPAGGARSPTIFVVGWLSCDTVEAPAGTKDASQLVLQAIAQLTDFASARLEKAGVGDSEGECGATDFLSELGAYRAAFRRIADSPFVDRDRIFILGISNGAGFAPLVAEGAPVRGYVVNGGWIKTWHEHMLEIERRRLALAGHPAAELNALMKSEALLYGRFLLEGEAPRAIFARDPSLGALWDGDPDRLYGRPVAYYQQLQALDLLAAWNLVRSPVLALHGEFDWIMSAEDPQILVELLNRNAPGSAEFVSLKGTGHTFEHYGSLQAAYSGNALPFDHAIAARIVAWFERRR